MTTSQRFKRRNHGNGHSYTLDGHKIPGVTTIIGVLDKPGLVNWASEVTAQYAVDNWAHLSSLQMIPRYEELKRARFNVVKKAADQGKRIHALADKIAQGHEVEVPAELEQPVEAYARFLDRWDFETLWTEAPVCNFDYRYGGTLDLICRSDRFGTSLIDTKTGKGVYDDFALQQAAYRHADVLLREIPQTGPRGGKKPSIWVEEPMPEIDTVLIAHVTGDTVDLKPIKAGPDVFEQFLFCLALFEGWIKRTSWTYKSEATFDPTIGPTIYPEMTLDAEGFPTDD